MPVRIRTHDGADQTEVPEDGVLPDLLHGGDYRPDGLPDQLLQERVLREIERGDDSVPELVDVLRMGVHTTLRRGPGLKLADQRIDEAVGSRGRGWHTGHR